MRRTQPMMTPAAACPALTCFLCRKHIFLIILSVCSYLSKYIGPRLDIKLLVCRLPSLRLTAIVLNCKLFNKNFENTLNSEVQRLCQVKIEKGKFGFSWVLCVETPGEI